MKKILFIISSLITANIIAQSFINHNNITTSSAPRSTDIVYLVDTDNDGDKDILAFNSGYSLNFFLMENKGDNTFESIREIDVPDSWMNNGYVDFKVGYINNDSLIDIVYSYHWYDCKLKWIENLGDNEFKYNPTCLNWYSSSSSTAKFLLHDLNGDNLDDIITKTADNIKVKISQGDGSFNPNFEIEDEGKLRSFACSDIDNDNDLDIIFNKRDPYRFGAYLNNGNGEFDSTIIIDSITDVQIYDYTIFDTDNNGYPDIISLFYDTIFTLKNIDGYNFERTYQYKNPMFSSYSIHTLDIEGDGDLDIINYNWDLLENKGNNNFVFKDNNDIIINYYGFDIGDLNENGVSDIIFGHYSGAIAYVEDFSNDSVLNWKTLTSKVLIPIYPQVIDFDGDSIKDLCILDKGVRFVSFKNNGKGEFNDTLAAKILHSSSNGSCFFDINHDGLIDIISYNDYSYSADTSHFKIARNIGNGEFFHIWIDDFNSTKHSFSHFIDYDNDGILNSILVNDWGDDDYVLIFDINTDFSMYITDTIYLGLYSSINDVLVSDIDINGENDLIFRSDDIIYLAYNIDGTFSNNISKTIQLPDEIQDMAIADLNQSLFPEMIVLLEGELYVYEDFNGYEYEKLYVLELDDEYHNLVISDLNYDNIDELFLTSSSKSILISNLTSISNQSKDYDYSLPDYLYDNQNPLIYGDMDLDGDMDLICTDRGISNISWFENSFILQNFPMQNAIWTEQNAMYESNPAQTWTSLYKTESDTILNGKLYTNVYEYRIDPVLFDTVKNLYTSIRQEILQKKVYVIRHYLNDESEKLLLNFNVEEGDTVVLNAYHWNLNPYFNDSSFIVDSIRPLELTNGEPSRKHFLSNHDNGYPLNLELIEGVGSLVHPFGPKNDLLTKFSGISSELCCPEQLLCLTVDDEQVYQLSEESVCGDLEVWTSLQELTNRNFFDIYPNPTKEKLNINLLRSPQNAYEVSIYNNIGRKLISRSFEKQQVTLDIQNLNTGIYFLAISNGNECSTVKFVVID